MKPVLIALLVLVPVLLIGLCLWAYTPDLPRDFLATKYRVSAEDYRTVVGIRLRLRDTGPRNAPVLVLLHGFGSSLETWDAWAEQLSTQYRVIRYDLPGFGLTGADPTGDYTEARGLEVLMGVLDQLGIERATLIGNSMGGALAWEFAARYPTRVDRLVLISPDGFASPGFEYGKHAAVPSVLRILPYVLPKAFLRMNLQPAYGDPAALNDAIVTRYWDFTRAPGVRAAMIARLEQTVLTDPEPRLRAIDAPTLLLWGTQDGMIPFSNAADYRRDLKSCEFVELPGVGHVPFEEAPERSLKPLRDFLAGRPLTPPY